MRRLSAALIVLLASCSLDYDKEQTVSADQIPQMVFDGLKQTSVKDGRIIYTMEAERSEVYQTKKRVQLKNFQFQEYDSGGLPASRGSAESAVVNTGTNDATLRGKLTARSEEHGVTLQTGGEGGLSWSNEDRILKTEPNTGVTLFKDDGSKIEARALTLDLGANRLELEEGIQGTWTPETKQDANTPPAAESIDPAPAPTP